MIKLIGIAVVAVGFALRLNPLLVVVAAGIATGLAAGLSFHEVMALFGTYFVENRFMTLPVLLMLLERAGIVTLAQLKAGRRYAVVGIAAVSAVLTPPDILSQILLLVPMYLLYELAIIAIQLTGQKAAQTSDPASESAGS